MEAFFATANGALDGVAPIIKSTLWIIVGIVILVLWAIGMIMNWLMFLFLKYLLSL